MADHPEPSPETDPEPGDPSDSSPESESPEEIYREAFFRGPLPPPALLEQFDRIEPGAADRIIQMAEQEQAHRHELESRRHEHEAAIERGNQSLERRGQTFGFVLALIVLLGGLTLLVLGQSVQGFALVIGDGIALISLFLYNERQKEAAIVGGEEESPQPEPEDPDFEDEPGSSGEDPAIA